MTGDYFHTVERLLFDIGLTATKPNKNSTIYPIPRKSGKTGIVRGIGAQHIWFDEDITVPYNVFSINNVEENYFRNLVDEDAPYYVQIMATYYDLLYPDRPADWSYEEFLRMRLKPRSRYVWSLEPRKDWELRSLLYLLKRTEDKRKLKALANIFKELEGETE